MAYFWTTCVGINLRENTSVFPWLIMPLLGKKLFSLATLANCYISRKEANKRARTQMEEVLARVRPSSPLRPEEGVTRAPKLTKALSRLDECARSLWILDLANVCSQGPNDTRAQWLRGHQNRTFGKCTRRLTCKTPQYTKFQYAAPLPLKSCAELEM